MIAAEAPSDSTETIGQTQQGTIPGTAGYMRNRPGPRPPISAPISGRFGVMLYELLTGQRAFGGRTRSDCMAAALTTEPDWSAARQRIIMQGSCVPPLTNCAGMVGAKCGKTIAAEATGAGACRGVRTGRYRAHSIGSGKKNHRS
jgi:hypothetical protein